MSIIVSGYGRAFRCTECMKVISPTPNYGTNSAAAEQLFLHWYLTISIWHVMCDPKFFALPKAWLQEIAGWIASADRTHP